MPKNSLISSSDVKAKTGRKSAGFLQKTSRGLEERVYSMEQAAEDAAARAEVLNERSEQLTKEVKTTTELVRLGFIVIIATTAATVVSAIGMLITTMFSLHSLWSSQGSGIGNSPVNSCAVISREQ